MREKLVQVVDIIRRDPAVERWGFTGGSGGGAATTNTANMFIALKPQGRVGRSPPTR